MEKRIRITKVNKQDELRRSDMLLMKPAERMEAFIEMRDKMYPYQPLERVVTIRKLADVLL